jgi:hypothetical protein
MLWIWWYDYVVWTGMILLAQGCLLSNISWYKIALWVWEALKHWPHIEACMSRGPKWRGWQFHGSWLHTPLLLPHMLTILIRLMMWMSLTFCLWSASKCHIAITLPNNHLSLMGTCVINWKLLYRWGHNTRWLMMLISTTPTSEEDHHKSTCEDNQQSIICVVPVILEIRLLHSTVWEHPKMSTCSLTIWIFMYLHILGRTEITPSKIQ